MSNTEAKFASGEEVISRWRHRVESNERAALYPIGDGALAKFEIGPGRVNLLGGPPGSGKTAFAMQAVIDGMRLNPDLRVCVCNVEMGPDVLLDRQLARLSGIDLTVIRDRALTEEHADPLDAAFSTLESVADRLAFVSAPYNLANVAAVADETSSNFMLLDYIQRIPPPGDSSDKRGSVDATMDFLRQFADAGTAVFVLAAVARTKDSKGRSSYDEKGLGLASFRESSELEFGADDAYILVRGKGDDDRVVLRHLKARHSEICDIELDFDRARQRFTTLERARGASPEVLNQLRSAWDSIPDSGEKP